MSVHSVAPQASGRPWARLVAVAAIAAALVVGGGPAISAIAPALQSIVGGAAGETTSPDGESSPSATPLESEAPSATPSPTPTPSQSPTPTPAPSVSPSASPAPSSGSGATWVVRRNDTISGICLQIGGDENCIKKILELNGIADPRTIQPGQVLQLP